MSKTYHIHLEVRTFLMKDSDEFQEHIQLFSGENGQPVSVIEAKNFLFDELSKGREVIPIGECSNFDWKTGCQGHPSEEEA